MQRSLLASWPTTSLTVRLASYFAVCLTLTACSQVVDFDRSKIPDGTSDAGGSDSGTTGSGDSGTKDGGAKDAGMMIDAGDDMCDPVTHQGCMPNELCCADASSVLGCVPTSVAQCEGCGVACDSKIANDCTDRTCGCGAGAKVECSGAAPKCDATLKKCVECSVSADCSANATNKFCFAPGATANAKDNTCVACDRVTNAGCSGTTPLCNAAGVCEACTALGAKSCGAGLVCLATGACQCSTSADCANPNTPICDTVGASKICVGCTTDGQCNIKTAGTKCVTGGAGSTIGTCAACDPNTVDPTGCTGPNDKCRPGATPVCVDCLLDGDCAGTTPLCASNACVFCDNAGIPPGDRDTRCAAKGASTGFCATSGTKLHECAACDPTDDGGCSNPNLPACSNASVCVECTSAKLAKCNDNDNLCTTDTCPATTCVHTPVSVADAFSCTDDSCVPATGAIVHTLNDNNCDATPDCSTDECVGAGGDPVTGCKSTAVPALCEADSRSCTVPACSPSGVCSETPTVSLCNDGLTCTTDECVGAAGNPGTGCRFTSTCTNEDGFACTVPTCGALGCSEIPSAAACTNVDGFSCTVPTCTAQSGDPASGCTEVPSDPACVDDTGGADTCDPSAPAADAAGCLHL